MPPQRKEVFFDLRLCCVTQRRRFCAPERKRVGVNAQFLQQLRKLLPICIPSVYSREFGLLMTLAVVLLGRTWLDIWFSAFNGEVVKAIVTRNKREFVRKAVIEFGLMMWPMAVVNSMLKLTINSLAISFRSRLTSHAHEQYLKSLTFYKVTNLDNRLNNADQLLTQDIDKFADNLSHLYSDLAKPIVDIVLFAVKLGQALGSGAPFYMVRLVSKTRSCFPSPRTNLSTPGRVLFVLGNHPPRHLAAVWQVHGAGAEAGGRLPFQPLAHHHPRRGDCLLRRQRA